MEGGWSRRFGRQSGECVFFYPPRTFGVDEVEGRGLHCHGYRGAWGPTRTAGEKEGWGSGGVFRPRGLPEKHHRAPPGSSAPPPLPPTPPSASALPGEGPQRGASRNVEETSSKHALASVSRGPGGGVGLLPPSTHRLGGLSELPGGVRRSRSWWRPRSDQVALGRASTARDGVAALTVGWTGSEFCGRRTRTGSGTPRTATTRRHGREQLSAAGPQRQRQQGAGPGLLAPPRAPPPRPPLAPYSQPGPVRVPAPPVPGQRAPFPWRRGKGLPVNPQVGADRGKDSALRQDPPHPRGPQASRTNQTGRAWLAAQIFL